MKVVVCIKQVPDTKGGVKFKPDGTLDRGAMLAIMNPDDKAGLEAALRLKDEYGAEVTVVTMGLPKAEAVLLRVHEHSEFPRQKIRRRPSRHGQRLVPRTSAAEKSRDGFRQRVFRGRLCPRVLCGEHGDA